jgi:hypothetical protein
MSKGANPAAFPAALMPPVSPDCPSAGEEMPGFDAAPGAGADCWPATCLAGGTGAGS